ncbi:AAA family ATPase [Leptolyngbya sp. AN02str]|uniref:AAA family ATPase n=1 Tax=Leptolyngbya sp. AN02str TaxID=3423363 RepID=UPI003D31253C
MIPLQLTLKNFLSYRDATIDFRGLHVACICGVNGAGKSSLLEAIAWALWGESRAAIEDDAIHMGETEAQVSFTFQCFERVYRVIRARYRGQSSSLEFQVQTSDGFRSLTAKGLRATQQLIVQHIRLDYETFVHSAYLRQGHADEFMLKRPSDRKQVLADLLQLQQYDDLGDKAKERSRQLKAELTVLERNLEQTDHQLQQRETLTLELENLMANLANLQQQHDADTETLRQLRAAKQLRQSWVQQLNLQQQQQQHLLQDCQRLKQEQHQLIKQKVSLEGVLHQAEAIAAGCAEYHSLQTEEDLLSTKFHAHQAAQAQLQTLQQQYQTQHTALSQEQNRLYTQLEALHQQAEELQQTLSKATEIEGALTKLHEARDRLAKLDQLQVQAAPLLQRRQQLLSQLEHHQARLIARSEALQTTAQQLQQHNQRQPQLQQAVIEVATAIQYLEKRRLYQQQVLDKGLERRSFLERLQDRQRHIEAQIVELDHKIVQLKQGAQFSHSHPEFKQDKAHDQTGHRSHANPGHAEPSHGNNGKNNNGKNSSTNNGHHLAEAAASYGAEDVPNGQGKAKRKSGKAQRSVEPDSSQPTLDSSMTETVAIALDAMPFPPCPVCDRPLDEHHLQIVMERHLAQKQELQDQIWVIREQLATSDREIQLLRQEYRDLEEELGHYNSILERHGKLQEQLHGATHGQHQLAQIRQEQEDIERSLQTGSYALEVHEELRLLDQTLQTLNYDDKNHALARGEVDRWRWAEIKQAEMKQAQRRLARVQEQVPTLEQRLAIVETQLDGLHQSEAQQHIRQLEQHIEAIAYNLEEHTTLRNKLRKAQAWQLRQQELQQAQQTYPQLQQRQQDLTKLLETRTQALKSLTEQMERMVEQIEQTPNPETAIANLETHIQARRTHLDEQLAHVGRAQQQQQQLELLSVQQRELNTQLNSLRRQLRVYTELSQAFGKNGIQALMIENVLPHLEAETNHILSRLSNHQLHIQFVTQRSRRKGGVNSKLIETLDILIADAQGTRPYETYSGGEAFRINFAIRLALARLLAQRSGAALQMLVVDEGFGTQDEAGCDRLIAAIQAIANDFSCILTVTHMPRLKEAFQHRIEVTKTAEGSQVQLVV